VADRRTGRRRAKAEGRSVRQTGGRGQYGHVIIEIEPLEAGQGFEFQNKIVGGTVPREYVPAIEAGAKEAMEGGILAGYPMIDIGVTLLDGSYHDVDSSEMAFKIAGHMAFQAASQKAGPVLKEPVMAVEIVTPDEYLGDCIGDLNSRRGRIGGMEPGAGGAQGIKAQVPLAEMVG